MDRTGLRRTALLGGIAVIILLRGMLGRIALLLLVSATLAYLLHPLESFFAARLRVGRGVATALACAAAVLLLGVFLAFGVPAAAKQAGKLSATAPAVLESLLSALEWASVRLAALGLPEGMLRGLQAQAGDLMAAGAAFLMEKVGVVVRAVTSRGYLIFAPVLAFYLLRDRGRLFGFMTRLLPSKRRMEVLRVAQSVSRALAAYRDGQVKVSLITGGLTALGLMVLGIEGWLLLGAVMVACNLIPYFGPWLGAAPVVLFAAEKGLWGVAGGVAVVFAAQQVESLAVSPRVIGDAAQMHPALVIVALLAGGWLAGLPGMFYAIPAMLCIRAALAAVGESRRQM